MSNAEAIKRNTTPPESEQTSGEAAGQSEASDGHLSSGKDPKFLCGVGLSVYQTSGRQMKDEPAHLLLDKIATGVWHPQACTPA